MTVLHFLQAICFCLPFVLLYKGQQLFCLSIYKNSKSPLYLYIFLLNNLKRCCWLFYTGFFFFRGADSFLIFLTCSWTAWTLLSRARSKILTSSHPLQIREFHSYIKQHWSEFRPLYVQGTHHGLR